MQECAPFYGRCAKSALQWVLQPDFPAPKINPASDCCHDIGMRKEARNWPFLTLSVKHFWGQLSGHHVRQLWIVTPIISWEVDKSPSLHWTVDSAYCFETVLIKSLWDWQNSVPIALVPSAEFITGGYCGGAPGRVGGCGGQTCLKTISILACTVDSIPLSLVIDILLNLTNGIRSKSK